MTSQRSNPDTDEVRDSLVTRSYKDVATEQAPASLNESVLRQAAAATGKGYSGSMRWLRPMAWAATVLLSLTVVVQLSNVPQPEMDLPKTPASQAIPTEPDTEPKTSPELAIDRAASADEVLPTGRFNEQRQAAKSVSADDTAFHRDEAPLLEEAENMARMRTGPVEDSGDAALASNLSSDYPASYPAAAFEAVPACDHDVRERPEDWLACIEELEAAGLDDSAAEQRLQLAERYPNFEMPEP